MSDNCTAVSPSNLTSPSILTSPPVIDNFNITGGLWFYTVAGLIDLALGIPANGWSLHVILTSGGHRGSLIESEIITLNLFAMEVVYYLTFILTLINFHFLKNVSMFLVLYGLYGIELSGRSLFQCLICLERYLAVVHPVVFLRYKPLRYRLACCGLIWLLAVVYGCILFLLFIFNIPSIPAILALFLPVLFVDLFCSLSILKVLRQPGPGDGGRERGRDGGKEEDREEEGGMDRGRERGREQKGRSGERGKVKEEGKNQQKKRAFRIVSFMMGMLLFNYVPLIMCTPLEKVLEPQVYTFDVLPVTVSFSLLGSSVHALLYLHRAGRLPCFTPTTRGCQQNN